MTLHLSWSKTGPKPKSYPVDDWMRRISSGASMVSIGRDYGCSGMLVSYVLHSRGIRPMLPGAPRRSPAFIRSARSLWDLGLTASEIGKALGVKKNVIIGVAHRNDFPARPSPIKRDGSAG